MTFDFKKQYKEFYRPGTTPEIVDVPTMSFIAIRGAGDPNVEDGSYKQAVGVLYAIAYTIKMSYKGNHEIEGFFEYVVPPLEGFWWQEGIEGVDFTDKKSFNWISVIRVPDFVTPEVFEWAKSEAARKKKIDCSLAELTEICEGLCVQAMHVGRFDDEPRTVSAMDAFAEEHGYALDFGKTRLHHEIYLSDPRKTAVEKCKTIIRHPIRNARA